MGSNLPIHVTLEATKNCRELSDLSIAELLNRQDSIRVHGYYVKQAHLFRGQRYFSSMLRKGNYKSFDLASGKLLENTEAKDFFNGELQYTITGPNSAIFSGNAGSEDVELVKDERSLTFIETTLMGNKHIMIIEDKWDAKEKGFKFTYIRNTMRTGSFWVNFSDQFTAALPNQQDGKTPYQDKTGQSPTALQ